MRRRRIHGHLRRRSSCKPSPLKHKEGNMAAHSYMSEGKYHGATAEEAESTRVGTSSAPNQNSIVLVDPDKYKKEKKQPEDKDSLGENLVEVFDPTGISSWDDAARAYNKEKWGFDDYLDMASVIPFAGKLTKLLKGAKGGINLAKAGFSASKAAQQGLEGYEAATDIYQDNIKGGVGGGGKKKSKSRSSGWSYYGGIK
jgi:hypothetical protein